MASEVADVRRGAFASLLARLRGGISTGAEPDEKARAAAVAAVIAKAGEGSREATKAEALSAVAGEAQAQGVCRRDGEGRRLTVRAQGKITVPGGPRYSAETMEALRARTVAAVRAADGEEAAARQEAVRRRSCARVAHAVARYVARGGTEICGPGGRRELYGGACGECARVAVRCVRVV